MADTDNFQTFDTPGTDGTDPVGDAPANDGGERDDDELVRNADDEIAKWQTTSGTPSLTQVQELFHKSICAGASPMARDKIVAAVTAAFGAQLGGKRALGTTWNQIANQCAQAAREKRGDTKPVALTPAEKAKQREALSPAVRDLAQAPDLMDRVVQQVQSMGVVNERELIVLTYIAATSRLLEHPVNLLVKGASGSGKSFTTTRTLELIGLDFVNHLTSSSALSLVYDDRPLAHTVLFIGEANQLQADENSTFAMLVRTLISEGRIVHQTTVEDPDSPTGRRVERIVREGPITLVVTTTGELHVENETRMLSLYVGEGRDQTRAVMVSLAAHAAGAVPAPLTWPYGTTFSAGSPLALTTPWFRSLNRLRLRSSPSWSASAVMLARYSTSSRRQRFFIKPSGKWTPRAGWWRQSPTTPWPARSSAR